MKKEKTEYFVYAAMFVFFTAMLITGTFHDYPIAKTLYSEHNVIATLITTLGVYPFFTGAVFFLGALSGSVSRLNINIAVRIPLCVLFILVAVFVGFIGAGAIVDVDCLGGIFPVLNKNIPVTIALSIIIEYPLCFLGFRLARRSEDNRLLKKIIIMIIFLLVTYISMTMIKDIFGRPRFRSVAVGYEGVDFVPWYTPFTKVAEMKAKYGLAASEFRSFPSGHGVFVVTTVYILLSLSWFFKKLQTKRGLLLGIGFSYAVIIMFTRMVLGAHYLSDVSAGGIIGMIFLLAFTFIMRRLER